MCQIRWATPPNFEVKSAHLLHFEPIFDPPLKKIVRETPIPNARKTLTFSSARKNLEAQHPLGAKI